jgi:hypothetical protein
LAQFPLRLLPLLVIAFHTMAQDSPRIEFEVVSVKPSPEPDPAKGYVVGCSGGPGSKDPGIFRCTNMNLPNLLTRAYDIMNYQLIAPQSMRDQRYEIVAKAPEGAASGQLKRMIQSMLRERFKLAVHHETREMPKYYLTVAKSGPKLDASVEAHPKRMAIPRHLFLVRAVQISTKTVTRSWVRSRRDDHGEKSCTPLLPQIDDRAACEAAQRATAQACYRCDRAYQQIRHLALLGG